MSELKLPEYDMVSLFERAKQDPSWEEDPEMRSMLADAFLFLLQFSF